MIADGQVELFHIDNLLDQILIAPAVIPLIT